MKRRKGQVRVGRVGGQGGGLGGTEGIGWSGRECRAGVGRGLRGTRECRRDGPWYRVHGEGWDGIRERKGRGGEGRVGEGQKSWPGEVEGRAWTRHEGA